MNDAATTKLANSLEPAKSEQASQQIQADQTGLSGLQGAAQPDGFFRSAHRLGTEAAFPQLRGKPTEGKLSTFAARVSRPPD